MAAKYLDYAGVTYLWSKIKDLVGSVYAYKHVTTDDGVTIDAELHHETLNLSGAGGTSTSISIDPQTNKRDILITSPSALSCFSGGPNSTHFTEAEKTKLAGIEEGAEENQFAYSTVMLREGGTTAMDAPAKILAAPAKESTLCIYKTSSVITMAGTPAGENVTNPRIAIGLQNCQGTPITNASVSATNSATQLTTGAAVAAMIGNIVFPEGAAPSSATPLMDGTASVGSCAGFSRGDHRHPTNLAGTKKTSTADLAVYGYTQQYIESCVKPAKSTWCNSNHRGLTVGNIYLTADTKQADNCYAAPTWSAMEACLAAVRSEASTATSVTDHKPTLAFGTCSAVAKIGNTTIHVAMPAKNKFQMALASTATAVADATSTTNAETYLNLAVCGGNAVDSVQVTGAGATTVTGANGKLTISSTNTVNTAGATTCNARLYIVGAKNSNQTSAQTYMNTKAYAEGGLLYSNCSQVLTTAMKGANSGVAPLDSNGKIDAQYLPSYVDDVIEAYPRSGQTALSQNWLATGSSAGAVIAPQAGVIYVLMSDTDDYSANSQFRWGGSSYIKLNDGGVSALTNPEIARAIGCTYVAA